jgi:hypothetical protein
MDGLNLLNSNLYFRPDTKPEMVTIYFRFVENKLDTWNFHVIMITHLTPLARLEMWSVSSEVPSYSEVKGDALYTSTWLLSLRQCTAALGKTTCLTWVFLNSSHFGITFVDNEIVMPDTYHSPLIINIQPHWKLRASLLQSCIEEFYITFSRLTPGLSHVCRGVRNQELPCWRGPAAIYQTDGSGVYDATTVDDTVASFNATVPDAKEKAISSGLITESKFLHWFCSSFRHSLDKRLLLHAFWKEEIRLSLQQNFLLS